MSKALPPSEESPIRDLADLADRIADQPSLFGHLPDSRVIREAKEFIHTGTTAIRDHAKVARIVAGYLSTNNLTRTAKEVGVSRQTVSAVLKLLEDAGKLVPMKERFERARMEVGLATAEMVQEVLDSGDRDTDAAAMLRAGWVGLGVVSQAIAAPAPVAPAAHTHLHLHGPTALDAAAEYERMMRAATVDVQSEVVAPKSLAGSASTVADTVRDTFGAPSAEASAARLEPTDPAAKGGGGGARAAGPAHTDGKPSENF